MKRITIVGIGFAGVFLAAAGLILKFFVVPMVIESKIAETIAIRKGTEAFDRWETLPVDILFRVYVFEVTNADAITNAGAKPIVKQRGPFVYREKRFKKNVVLHEDDDRAEYMQGSSFTFDDKLSGESDEEIVTVVNVPAIGFAQIAESLPGLRSFVGIFDEVINIMWPGDPVFVKVKVKDYLFKGIEMLCHGEGISDVIQKLKLRLMCLAYDKIRPVRTVIIDDQKKGLNTFSFFKYKEQTLDGPYVVRLGIDDPKRIGEIISWKGKEDLGTMWGGKSCSRVHGTDSTVFRPFLHDVDTLSVFNSDISRTINLTYEGPTEFRGVPARRYVAEENFLASVLKNEENYCYCPRSVKGLTAYSGCLRSGVLDISSSQGAPVYLSHPHFLMADPMYQMGVEGLSPRKDIHQIFIDIEPNTGYPLRGASRAQMNVFLKKMVEVDWMKNYPNVVVPTVWVDEGVELSSDLVDEVKSRLLTPMKIADYATWVMIVGGAVAAVISIVVVIKRRRDGMSTARA